MLHDAVDANKIPKGYSNNQYSHQINYESHKERTHGACIKNELSMKAAITNS